MSSADSYSALTGRLLEGQSELTVTKCWIDMYGRIYVGRPYIGVDLYYQTSESTANKYECIIVGDSRPLAFGIAMGTTPPFALWNRLMECPDEITDCRHPELITQIIERLRTQYWTMQ